MIFISIQRIDKQNMEDQIIEINIFMIIFQRILQRQINMISGYSGGVGIDMSLIRTINVQEIDSNY